jgi:molybdopterin-guanine dinucleotide biosynthesis protein A
MTPSLERLPLAAAILAGGRARRFGGRDKSRHAVEGRPIINRQMDVLQQLTARVLIITGDAARFADIDAIVQPDVIEGAGTLGGIYTALDTAHADRVIIVGCDLPFLDLGLLRRLADLAIGRDGAWVRTSRGPEPLLACYKAGANGRIRERLDARLFKASELGEVLDLAEVGDAEVARFGPVERLLANINTPADHARLAGGHGTHEETDEFR